MFSTDMFFEPILLRLASEVADYSVPGIQPLPCDRWLARSCLQKAIRRGEAEIAQRAFLNLLAYDPRAAWRHLVVIAIEDVGVPAFDLVEQVVCAARDRRTRRYCGGDWRLGSYLVRQMAESVHCQAVCDLLLRSINDPAWEQSRGRMLEAPASKLVDLLAYGQSDLPTCGMAALALGGELAAGQRLRDPALVFETLADSGHSLLVVEIARAAWRASRNPMALLLPLVHRAWRHEARMEVHDDTLPQARSIAGIPEYAIDQFTRVGRWMINAYLRADTQLRGMLDAADIPAPRRVAVVGDLIFLVEGTCLLNRATWNISDELRSPRRALAGAFMLGDMLEPALAHIDANRAAITALRRRYLTPGPATSTPGQRQ